MRLGGIACQERFPRIFSGALSTMVHEPHGPRNSRESGMEDGKYTKHFRKEITKETLENHNGYPKYRRTNNGVNAQKNVYRIDIVPYKT